MQIKNPDTGRSTALRMGIAMAVIAVALITILGGSGVANATGCDFSLSTGGYSGVEGTDIPITVTRSGGTCANVVLLNVVAGGSAAAGTNYNAPGAPGIALPFTTSDTSRTWEPGLDTIDDVGTGNKTVLIALSFQTSANGDTVSHTPATVTILDNDGGPNFTFSQSNYEVSEGTNAQVTVTRSGSLTGTASVAYATSNGSATAGSDYTAASGTLNFGAGVATQSFFVQTTPDAVVDDGEQLNLTLSNPSGGGSVGAPATITIRDNNGTGFFQFTSGSFTVAENSGAALLSISRNGGSVGVVVVSCTPTGGTATNGIDYTAPANVTFAQNQTSGSCVVPIANDGAGEISETATFSLGIVSGAGATASGQTTTTLTITDAGGIGTVQFASLNYTGFEADQQAIITLTRTNGTSGVVNVYCTTQGIGSATPGVDYQTGSFLATFADGVSTATCAIPLVNDGVAEGPESLQLGLTAASSGATIGTQQLATLTILDNGTGFVTVTSVSPAIGPTVGGTTVTITGTNFTGATSVTFDGLFATIISNNGSVMTVSSPVHAVGTVDVVVNTPSGSNTTVGTANDFTYTSSTIPVVTSVTPASGPTGTSVTILGSGFSGVTCPSGITFGGIQASSTGCNVNSDSSITAKVPANAPAGIIDVRVTNAVGTSANTSADNFNNTSNLPTLSYTLISRFTLIGWAGIDNISVASALKGLESPNDNPATNDVSGVVTAIWRFDAATQSYKGYFPGSENVPGANDFTTLRKGTGYFFAINVATKVWTVIEG